MIYWNQILYTIGSYNIELNISDIIPDLYFFQQENFTDLPLELGGKIKKKRGLEKIVQ